MVAKRHHMQNCMHCRVRKLHHVPLRLETKPYLIAVTTAAAAELVDDFPCLGEYQVPHDGQIGHVDRYGHRWVSRNGSEAPTTEMYCTLVGFHLRVTVVRRFLGHPQPTSA